MAAALPICTAQEILIKSRRLIADRGFAQRTYQDPSGCICALAALRISAFGRPYTSADEPNSAAYKRASYALGIAIGRNGHYYRIVEWNDTPGRTREQVLAAFDRAAAWEARNS